MAGGKGEVGLIGKPSCSHEHITEEERFNDWGDFLGRVAVCQDCGFDLV
jgi:hypothetical protein